MSEPAAKRAKAGCETAQQAPKAQSEVQEMPLLPITSARTIEHCKAFVADARTIFITSYPKSGTTWTQFICYTLATAGAKELDHISNYCPFFEADRSWADSGATAEPGHSRHAGIGWQIFNSHLRYEMMPTGGEAKFLYLIRDAKDVCTSFFHHLSHQALEDGGFEGTIDEYVEQWVGGKIHFGRWTDHLKSWLSAAKKDPRILLLSYAAMKEDMAGAVNKIVAHCGFGLTAAQVEALLPLFTFENMKANLSKFDPTSVKWRNKGDGFQFIRKGTVGDYKNVLSAGHVAKIQTLINGAFDATELAEIQAFASGVTSGTGSAA